MTHSSDPREAILLGGGHDDGTQQEDLEIYRQSLNQYRQWFVRETPEAYMGRLNRIIQTLDEDPRILDGLMARSWNDPAEVIAIRDQALMRLFHALIVVLDGSKWLLAREGVRDPIRSFSDAFRSLAERGILAPEKVDVYRSLCRLRNRLAHSLDELPSPGEVRLLLGVWLPELRNLQIRLRQHCL